VVVHELNIERFDFMPPKADAILIVDSDAVLAGPVSFQSLQTVAWSSRQITQRGCGVQGIQPPPSCGFNVDETCDPFSLE
jgi:hypothetical protein